MELVRPEVKAAIWRFREAAFGLVMAAVGMYWAVTSYGVLSAAGMSISVAASLLIFAGLQRARFRVPGAGAGLVQVDERQVIYYGPHDGGVVSVDNLERLELDPAIRPSGAWILTEPGAAVLEIPTNAENADALFDVFAALDGLDTEHMLRQLAGNPRGRVLIWQHRQNAQVTLH
ncbi:hypothetical protein [Anianabacter salinae]|uniref:hypothetical protein n=1 Tax=Anianabacter salinae TaxID=2851023 RepID=UPI00225DED64|nr:hypothetical protein [Anianabacter salinae]